MRRSVSIGAAAPSCSCSIRRIGARSAAISLRCTTNSAAKFAWFSNAALLPISVDGVWSHAAFGSECACRSLPVVVGLRTERPGCAEWYGVYNETDGVSQRALFVVDANGMIGWSYLSPDAVNPGADGILTALEALAGDHS